MFFEQRKMKAYNTNSLKKLLIIINNSKTFNNVLEKLSNVLWFKKIFKEGLPWWRSG